MYDKQENMPKFFNQMQITKKKNVNLNSNLLAIRLTGKKVDLIGVIWDQGYR